MSASKRRSGHTTSDLDTDDELTSTYRATFGGPKGLEPTTWTDAGKSASPSTGTPASSQHVTPVKPPRRKTRSGLPGTLSSQSLTEEDESEFQTPLGTTEYEYRYVEHPSGSLPSTLSPVPSGSHYGSQHTPTSWETTSHAMYPDHGVVPRQYRAGNSRMARNLYETDSFGADAAPSTRAGSFSTMSAPASSARDRQRYAAGSAAASSVAASSSPASASNPSRTTTPQKEGGDHTRVTAAAEHAVAQAINSGAAHSKQTSLENPSNDAVWAKLEANIAAASKYEYEEAGRRFYEGESPAKPSTAAADAAALNSAPTSGVDGRSAAVTSREAETAAHQAAALLSLIATGGFTDQRTAAQRLLTSMKTYGDPVRKATHAVGGVAVLQTMVAHKNEELKNLSTSLLAELCTLPEARKELASAPKAASNAVGAACQSIAKGDVAAANLLAALARDTSECRPLFLAACAEHKAVRVLLDGSTNHSHSHEARESCVDALEALCDADPASGYKKLAWAGGLAKIAAELDENNWRAPLKLLLGGLRQDKSLADSLCDVNLIYKLSQFISNPSAAMELQIGAAFILSCIAEIRLRKEEITQALLDFALPRGCEVLHDVPSAPRTIDSVVDKDSKPKAAVESEELQLQCAMLCGHLGIHSDVCCNVLIFHTAVLKTVLMVLTQSRNYMLAKQLIAAAASYAGRCDKP